MNTLNKPRNSFNCCKTPTTRNVSGGFIFCSGLTMKFVLWTIACVMGMPAVAWGVCDGGMYLNGTTCEKCVDGYYCPGDDTQHPCPTDTTDWYGFVSTLYPVDRVTQQSWLMSWNPGSSTNGAIWPAHCFAGVFISSPYGELYIESWYNGTDYWNGQSAFLWYRANPGYYLAQYVGTTWHTWYRYARPCTNLPEHAHYTGAGTPAQSDSSPTNDCPWECDAGYGNHDGTCVPLCGAGIGKIKTGNGRTFNLYPVAYTTPSLRIGYGGKTCYGVLKSGAAASINVRYNDQTYHLSD